MTNKQLYDLLISEALKYMHTDFTKYVALLEMAYDLRMQNGGKL